MQKKKVSLIYISNCKKLRWLRFDLMDQLSFLPFVCCKGQKSKSERNNVELIPCLGDMKNLKFFARFFVMSDLDEEATKDIFRLKD